MFSCPSYLILMLTNKCNLSCSYCYLGNNKAKKESGMDMPKVFIDRAILLLDSDQKSLHVQLTGGEPFLVPGLVEYASFKIREKYPNASIGIQTNATLINDKAINIIEKFKLKLGISLDGEPPLQESQRGKANDTFKGLHLLEQRKIPFNITTVVTKENADKLHRLVLMLGNFTMARGLGLDCLVLKGKALENSVLKADPDQIKSGIKNMVQALKMVNASRNIPLVIRELGKLNKIKQKHGTRFFCNGAMGNSLAVTPQGMLYPCSQTAFDPKFFLGALDPVKPDSVLSLNLSSKLEDYILNRRTKEKCNNCDLNTQCPGDCPSRLYYNGKDGDELICTIYRSFYKSA